LRSTHPEAALCRMIMYNLYKLISKVSLLFRFFFHSSIPAHYCSGERDRSSATKTPVPARTRKKFPNPASKTKSSDFEFALFVRNFATDGRKWREPVVVRARRGTTRVFVVFCLVHMKAYSSSRGVSGDVRRIIPCISRAWIDKGISLLTILPPPPTITLLHHIML
jgi:hypothetical protein